MFVTLSELADFLCVIVVTCSSLSAPNNGAMSGSAVTYQSVITFSCKTGYNIGGSSSRTCQADGTWSGTTVSCASKWCYSQTVLNGVLFTHNVKGYALVNGQKVGWARNCQEVFLFRQKCCRIYSKRGTGQMDQSRFAQLTIEMVRYLNYYQSQFFLMCLPCLSYPHVVTQCGTVLLAPSSIEKSNHFVN